MTPAATTLEGMLSETTLPAPMLLPRPIVTPAKPHSSPISITAELLRVAKTTG